MTTDTTRKGLELPTPPKIHDGFGNEILDAIDALKDYGQQCCQAAKADELAFLEDLIEHVDSFIWKRIDDRIAELKGEK